MLTRKYRLFKPVKIKEDELYVFGQLVEKPTELRCGIESDFIESGGYEIGVKVLAIPPKSEGYTLLDSLVRTTYIREE